MKELRINTSVPTGLFFILVIIVVIGGLITTKSFQNKNREVRDLKSQVVILLKQTKKLPKNDVFVFVNEKNNTVAVAKAAATKEEKIFTFTVMWSNDSNIVNTNNRELVSAYLRSQFVLLNQNELDVKLPWRIFLCPCCLFFCF